MKFTERLKNIGPAAIVTGAFIGPGTITTTTISGIKYKYNLLWVVLFATISLYILMEMAGRVGIISGKSITEIITKYTRNKYLKLCLKILIASTLISVAFGFEAGNITGASVGLGDLFGINQFVASIILGICILYVTYVGTAQTVEKFMSIIVGIMGIIFVITMFWVKPNFTEVAQGMMPSGITLESSGEAIALIGTILIGINLLMQTITNGEKWKSNEDLKYSKIDSFINVSVGGLIATALIVTSGSILYGYSEGVVQSPIIYSQMLEPILGKYARQVGNIGLVAAGFSSAVATPLILKTVLSRMMKWDINDWKSKLLSTLGVAFGILFSAFGKKPIQIIVFASALSGISLPVLTICILISANIKQEMGKYKNTRIQNILGIVVVLLTTLLAINTLINFISFIKQ